MKNLDLKIKLLRAARLLSLIGSLSCLIAININPALTVLGIAAVLLLWFGILFNNLFLRLNAKRLYEEVESMFKEYKKEGNE